jgi:hypothetical protein
MDYYKQKFEKILEKAGRVRELQKLGRKRGYLTMDEKQRLARVQTDLDRMIDQETEELKKVTTQPILKF